MEWGGNGKGRNMPCEWDMVSVLKELEVGEVERPPPN